MALDKKMRFSTGSEKTKKRVLKKEVEFEAKKRAQRQLLKLSSAEREGIILRWRKKKRNDALKRRRVINLLIDAAKQKRLRRLKKQNEQREKTETKSSKRVATKEMMAEQRVAAKERMAKERVAAKERMAEQRAAAKERMAEQRAAAKERMAEQREALRAQLVEKRWATERGAKMAMEQKRAAFYADREARRAAERDKRLEEQRKEKLAKEQERVTLRADREARRAAKRDKRLEEQRRAKMAKEQEWAALRAEGEARRVAKREKRLREQRQEKMAKERKRATLEAEREVRRVAKREKRLREQREAKMAKERERATLKAERRAAKEQEAARMAAARRQRLEHGAMAKRQKEVVRFLKAVNNIDTDSNEKYEELKSNPLNIKFMRSTRWRNVKAYCKMIVRRANLLLQKAGGLSTSESFGADDEQKEKLAANEEVLKEVQERWYDILEQMNEKELARARRQSAKRSEKSEMKKMASEERGQRAAMKKLALLEKLQKRDAARADQLGAKMRELVQRSTELLSTAKVAEVDRRVVLANKDKTVAKRVKIAAARIPANANRVVKLGERLQQKLDKLKEMGVRRENITGIDEGLREARSFADQALTLANWDAVVEEMSGLRAQTKATQLPVERVAAITKVVLEQGKDGIIEAVQAAAVSDGLKLDISCAKSGQPPKSFAYQDFVAYSLLPGSKIQRLLCVHRTGSGKTLTIIKILENYFDDPRSKAVVFPNSAVKENFYSELMSFDNRYKTYLEEKFAAQPNYINMLKAGPGERKRDPKLFTEVIEEVEKKLGLTSELATVRGKGRTTEQPAVGLKLKAPIRAYTYAQLGGAKIFPSKGGRPTDPIFNHFVTKQWEHGMNVFDDKIILMDEVHNLVFPGTGCASEICDNYKNAQEALSCAENVVVVGFTATPMSVDQTSGDLLMEIIRGKVGQGEYDKKLEPLADFYLTSPEEDENEDEALTKQPLRQGKKSKKMDEKAEKIAKRLATTRSGWKGFVSYFYSQPRTTFPEYIPDTCNVIDMENLVDNYTTKLKETLKKKNAKDITQLEIKDVLRLQNYCNVKSGSKVDPNAAETLLRENEDNLEDFCPKFVKIAESIKGSKHKSLVIIDRRHSMQLLCAVINKIGEMCEYPGRGDRRGGTCFARLLNKDSKVNSDGTLVEDSINTDILNTFNSGENSFGEKIKCLVIDAKTYSEGVSFFGVRELHITNPSLTYALHLQRVGRVFRSCRFVNDPEGGKQKIKVLLYYATSDDIYTADEFAYDSLLKNQKQFLEEMGNFENNAIDRGLYAKWESVATGTENLCNLSPTAAGYAARKKKATAKKAINLAQKQVEKTVVQKNDRARRAEQRGNRS